MPNSSSRRKYSDILYSFKNKDPNYVEGAFKKTRHPRSPSPKRKNYEQKALTKDDNKSRCTFVHPVMGKRCKNKLGLYPEYCHLHTMAIQNVYIDQSQIEQAGNGLYAGPFGFKKGDIIGRYSFPWNEVSLGTLEKRCKDEKCWSYIFCNEGDDAKTKCWDGLDIRSTLMRNINDAHKSKHKNNCIFDVKGKEVFVIAAKNIKPKSELFVSYGKDYWN